MTKKKKKDAFDIYMEERDIIEANIADDPLWAAQMIIDYGSRDLIEKLLTEDRRL